MITAFVMIDADPGRVPELAEELADVEGVAEVYSVAGDVDLVAVVRVRDYESVADVVTGRIDKCSGVRRSRTMLAFRSYSRRDVDAMWSIGLD